MSADACEDGEVYSLPVVPRLADGTKGGEGTAMRGRREDGDSCIMEGTSSMVCGRDTEGLYCRVLMLDRGGEVDHHIHPA